MNSVGELTPATLANPMIGGRVASTWEIADCTEFSSEMSAATPRVATEYLSATSLAASFAATPSMSRIATDQPSRANRSAVARPMPRGEAPPVITAVRAAGRGCGELMCGLPSGWDVDGVGSGQFVDGDAQRFQLGGGRLIERHPDGTCR